MKKFIKELIPYIIIIIVVTIIRTYIVTPVIVVGDSMVPTLKEKQILLLNINYNNGGFIMVEVYSLLFGMIGLISIVLYSLMYILRYVYYYFENKTLRRFINRLLPYFSRNNRKIRDYSHLLYHYFQCSMNDSLSDYTILLNDLNAHYHQKF